MSNFTQEKEAKVKKKGRPAEKDFMRRNVKLNVELYNKALEQSARTGQTVAYIINEGLRKQLVHTAIEEKRREEEDKMLLNI